MNDLKFLGGSFLDFDIPKDRLYLYHYFRTDIEKQFLQYYYAFECDTDFKRFTEHTGLHCQLRWLRLLKKRHDLIVEHRDKAKADFNIQEVALVESGKRKLYEMKVFRSG